VRHSSALDWLNFLLADVRGGLGPYVSVFLVTEAHWDAGTTGVLLTASGLLGIALHTPIGAFIDQTHAKRALIVAGVFALSGCAVAIASAPTLLVVFAADTVLAVLGAVFAPTVAAITLGLVAREELATRLGRNGAFDRAGNLFIAAVAGAVGTLFGQRAIFLLVPVFALCTVVAVISIPPDAIDHRRARGFPTAGAFNELPSPWSALLTCRPLLVLAAVAALFHFGNAAMLPLVSQKMALGHPGQEAVLTSGAIVTAQFVMVPMAALVMKADRIGRKPLLLVAVGALIARGVLFSVSENAFWLIALQALDGVGIGLFDTLLPLVLADIMRGSGRYNIARGLLGTVQGIGGSLSQAAGGLLAVHASYNAAFLVLAGVAAVPFILTWTALPETGRSHKARPDR
jgi:MFS family permease